MRFITLAARWPPRRTLFASEMPPTPGARVDPPPPPFVSSATAAARSMTRSHSMSVKSEPKIISAAPSDRRTSAAEFSSKSQARTALDSAYEFTASRAHRREAQRRFFAHGVRVAAPRNHWHHPENRESGGLVLQAPSRPAGTEASAGPR